MKDFSELELDFFNFLSPSKKSPKWINVLAGIRVYWWEKFSKNNKRTGTTIPDSRVESYFIPIHSISISLSLSIIVREGTGGAIVPLDF